jgi:hypothetical protein
MGNGLAARLETWKSSKCRRGVRFPIELRSGEGRSRHLETYPDSGIVPYGIGIEKLLTCNLQPVTCNLQPVTPPPIGINFHLTLQTVPPFPFQKPPKLVILLKDPSV